MLAALTLTLVAGSLGFLLGMRAMRPIIASWKESVAIKDETIALLKETIVILKETRDLAVARADE